MYTLWPAPKFFIPVHGGGAICRSTPSWPSEMGMNPKQYDLRHRSGDGTHQPELQGDRRVPRWEGTEYLDGTRCRRLGDLGAGGRELFNGDELLALSSLRMSQAAVSPKPETDTKEARSFPSSMKFGGMRAIQIPWGQARR